MNPASWADKNGSGVSNLYMAGENTIIPKFLRLCGKVTKSRYSARNMTLFFTRPLSSTGGGSRDAPNAAQRRGWKIPGKN
jgi:hypothetical protein